MRLLVLRAEPDAARTAARLRAAGHEPIVAPITAIETLPLSDPIPGLWAALLITSANAVPALVRLGQSSGLRNVPVFTVGERTGAAVREWDFASVVSADGDADDLAKLVGSRLHPPARLLYLAGERRAGDLADRLRAQGFAVETEVVYRAVAAENLPDAAIKALTAGVDGVLHYSRRSAAAYLRSARNTGMLAQALAATHYCLSARIAEPLSGAGAATIKVAPRPNETALFGLIEPKGG